MAAVAQCLRANWNGPSVALSLRHRFRVVRAGSWIDRDEHTDDAIRINAPKRQYPRPEWPPGSTTSAGIGAASLVRIIAGRWGRQFVKPSLILRPHRGASMAVVSDRVCSG